MCHDYRADTAMLTAEEQRGVLAALGMAGIADGTEQSGPVTGGTTGPTTQVVGTGTVGVGSTTAVRPMVGTREELAADLAVALVGHLERKLKELAWKETVPAVPMTAFEGAGWAARQVVDEEFARWTAGAAMTEPARRAWQGFAFCGSGERQNLFEATDRAGREQAGVPVKAHDLALWMAANDPSCQDIKRGYQFTTQALADRRFLLDRVITPFVEQRRTDLERYDLLGFAITNPETRRVVVAGKIKPGGDQHAERRLRWQVWKKLVHEYLHTLEHLNVPVATESSGIAKEGFCEMFTQDVMLRALRAIHQGARPDLVMAVQGGSDATVDADVIGGYATPGDYVDVLRDAKAVRGFCGPNGVRAAFFQGHVELLGLQLNGQPFAPAPTGGPAPVAVPDGVTTLAGLADASGVPVPDIVKANPNMVSHFVTTGQRLQLPGCRNHVLVYVRDDNLPEPVFETPEQVARQHGITLNAFYRANPALRGCHTFDDPDQGGHLLIPRH